MNATPLRIDISGMRVESDNDGNLGRHLLCEFFHCDSAALDDPVLIEQSLCAAATACKATILNQSFHKFTPQGVSGVALISESHLAIHTWPEYGYAAADCFTCSLDCDLSIISTILARAFHSQNVKTLEIVRGDLREA